MYVRVLGSDFVPVRGSLSNCCLHLHHTGGTIPCDLLCLLAEWLRVVSAARPRKRVHRGVELTHEDGYHARTVRPWSHVLTVSINSIRSFPPVVLCLFRAYRDYDLQYRFATSRLSSEEPRRYVEAAGYSMDLS